VSVSLPGLDPFLREFGQVLFSQILGGSLIDWLDVCHKRLLVFGDYVLQELRI